MAFQFNDEQLSAWAATYEKEVCARYNFIADRVSLAITSGINEYEIPNYFSNIRSVLYLGKNLYPKGFRASVMTGDTPFETSGALPFEYVFSGKGLRVLKLYPTPQDNIAVYNGDLWTPAADEAAFIVEGYRTGKSDDASRRLPIWLRRYILKDYVCMKAFTSEGPQQDLRAGTYYQERVNQHADYLGKLKDNIVSAQVNILYDYKQQTRRKPAHPVLPTNFGLRINY